MNQSIDFTLFILGNVSVFGEFFKKFISLLDILLFFVHQQIRQLVQFHEEPLIGVFQGFSF